MSGHPTYYATVEQNVKHLDQMLNDFLRYGLMHESQITAIEEALADLYRDPDTSDKHTPAISTLLDEFAITGDDAWQFVQDLRNAIGIVLTSPDTADSMLADEIENMRDLEYLKMYVTG